MRRRHGLEGDRRSAARSSERFVSPILIGRLGRDERSLLWNCRVPMNGEDRGGWSRRSDNMACEYRRTAHSARRVGRRHVTRRRRGGEGSERADQAMYERKQERRGKSPAARQAMMSGP